MLLKLIVKSGGEYQTFYEEEITLPDFAELSFEDKVELREQYVERLARGLEIKFQHYLEEREYHFELEAESKVHDEIKKLIFQDESKLKIA